MTKNNEPDFPLVGDYNQASPPPLGSIMNPGPNNMNLPFEEAGEFVRFAPCSSALPHGKHAWTDDIPFERRRNPHWGPYYRRYSCWGLRDLPIRISSADLVRESYDAEARGNVSVATLLMLRANYQQAEEHWILDHPHHH